MGIMKSRKTQFEFSPDEITKLVAADLNIDPTKIKVEFVQSDVSDDRFERTPRYVVTSIRVTIDEEN